MAKIKKLKWLSVLDWCSVITAVALLISYIPGLPSGYFDMVSILAMIFTLVWMLNWAINREWWKSALALLFLAGLFVCMPMLGVMHTDPELAIHDPTLYNATHALIVKVFYGVVIVINLFLAFYNDRATLKKKN